MSVEFIFIEPQVVGSLDRCEIHYGWNGERFKSQEEAIKAGFESRGSDDFNVCSLRGNRLIGCFWMNDPMNDPQGMIKIAEQHSFTLAKGCKP